jgi:pimeloyl-ACP methyl ester carboxylesterase
VARGGHDVIDHPREQHDDVCNACAGAMAGYDATLAWVSDQRCRTAVPVVIVAGAQDRFIESEQSTRLHYDISHSLLRCVPANGHMVHQTATSEIMSAIEMVADQSTEPA